MMIDVKISKLPEWMDESLLDDLVESLTEEVAQTVLNILDVLFFRKTMSLKEDQWGNPNTLNQENIARDITVKKHFQLWHPNISLEEGKKISIQSINPHLEETVVFSYPDYNKNISLTSSDFINLLKQILW